MVNIGAATFGSSIGLLNSSAYPSSQGTSVWLSNARPSAGGYTGCVAEDVLSTFNIPFTAGQLPSLGACSLPGYDINDMDAIQVIKLSLAAFMVNSQLWDIVVDGHGEAKFKQIYPSPQQVSLDVRSCLSTSLQEDVDNRVVIVRGYDAPPIRHIKSPENVIPKNKDSRPLTAQALVSTKCCVLSETDLYSGVENETTCNGRPYHRTAVVSYKDPILEAVYKDGVESLYEPTAFESIAGFVIDIDTGTTDLNVSYQQSATTTFSYTVPFGGLNSTGLECASYNTGSSYAKFAYTKYNVGTVETTDRFGDNWPLFLGVSNVKIVGHTIHHATDNRAGGGAIFLDIDDRIVHMNPPVSKNWHWAYENGQPVIYLYSPVYEDGLTDYIFELLSNANQSQSSVRPYRASNSWASSQDDFPLSSTGGSPGGAWPSLGAGIGTLVRALVFTIDLDRPSIVINDPKGEALTHANNLKIQYYPIVIEDLPPPVAYKINDTRTNTVDHTLDLYDNDPSTVQPSPQTVERSLTWLEAQKTGHTLDISLPFLETEDECKSVASFLYSLYDNFGSFDTTTYTLTCGPDDEPELGDSVVGFDSNLRVNEINYSYQDGSSYNINVTLGPIYATLGSWNTSAWQRKTETVQRQGIVTWSAGDGCTYRVRVQGLGEYFALNTSPLTTYFPGEKVSVTIHNNPVEA